MTEYNIKYYLIYLTISIVALILATQRDFKNTKNSVRFSNISLFIAGVLFFLLYGLRKSDVGTDTGNYLQQFVSYESIDYGTDFIMYYIFDWFHSFGLPFQFFLLLMSFLFIGALSLSIRRNAKEFNSNSLLIFFGFTSLFYFQSLGVNVIRQGVSLALLVLAMANYQVSRERRLSWIIPCVLSVLFHFTSIIPVLFYVFILYFEKITLKLFYLLYIFCLSLSVIGISFLTFKDYIGFLLVDERRSGYLRGTDEVYSVGFKPQFVAFNTIFLFFFIYIRSLMGRSPYYDSLLKYYLTLSSIFFLAFQIPYSDRWGLMSWIVIPILMSPIFSYAFPRRLYTITCFIFILIFIFFENYS